MSPLQDCTYSLDLLKGENLYCDECAILNICYQGKKKKASSHKCFCYYFMWMMKTYGKTKCSISDGKLPFEVWTRTKLRCPSLSLISLTEVCSFPTRICHANHCNQCPLPRLEIKRIVLPKLNIENNY